MAVFILSTSQLTFIMCNSRYMVLLYNVISSITRRHSYSKKGRESQNYRILILPRDETWLFPPNTNCARSLWICRILMPSPSLRGELPVSVIDTHSVLYILIPSLRGDWPRPMCWWRSQAPAMPPYLLLFLDEVNDILRYPYCRRPS